MPYNYLEICPIQHFSWRIKCYPGELRRTETLRVAKQCGTVEEGSVSILSLHVAQHFCWVPDAFAHPNDHAEFHQKAWSEALHFKCNWPTQVSGFSHVQNDNASPVCCVLSRTPATQTLYSRELEGNDYLLTDTGAIRNKCNMPGKLRLSIT